MLKVFFAGALAGLIVKAIVVGSYLARRRWRRWRIRQELRLIHGDKPRPLFTVYGELEERRRTKPPIRSLRNRGDDNAA